MTAERHRWHLLIHQIPPKPLYLRAKIRNRLVRVGAIALKNSVYVLPFTDECLEDFQWIAQEIAAGGGDAYVCRADFVDDDADRRLVERFRAERDAEFHRLAEEIRPLVSRSRRARRAGPDGEAAAAVERLRRRLAELVRIDFFGSVGRKEVEDLFAELERKLPSPSPSGRSVDRTNLRGRTWVTRKGVHVDRIGSAWLVRRFVDPGAKLRFVDLREGVRVPGEIRFDIPGGDFTHEGDRCTFETLVARLGLADPALEPIAEIVHDIDLKDGKFGRPEAAGIERLLHGLLLANPEDTGRIEHGFEMFDGLYESFRRRGASLPAAAPKIGKKGDSS